MILIHLRGVAMMDSVLGIVLAGGKGTRLEPLTTERAKPAVYFGGSYRIIDFTLSNCINSGLRRVYITTQFKAASLNRHIGLGWRFLSPEMGEFVDVLAPQQRINDHWYQGTADAVYQNIFTLERIPWEHLLILSGDHIYKMDYARMVQDHIDSRADATIGCIPVPLEQGKQFGVMGVDESQWVRRFEEKPESPFSMPDDSSRCLASMGIYLFRRKFLMDELLRDGADRSSTHDFGKSIIPRIIETAKVKAYPFRDRNTGEGLYWRDVGTLDSYYEANMDLVSVHPQLNLYDTSWPIRGFSPPLPPPKFVFANMESKPPRAGYGLDSLVCGGSIISGGDVKGSIISPNVRINSYSHVEDSILFPEVTVGRHSRIRKAIIDRGIAIPEHTSIGYDREADIAQGYTITENGITIVGQ